jgi:hypothetical protein
MGMRKDFLVTKEQKQQRQQRLEENRNMALTRLSTSESASSSSTSQSVSNLDYVSPTLDELDRVSFYFLILVQNLYCNRN